MPDTIEAAFNDITLAAALGNRMTASVLQDIRRWIGEGLEFGHVAINVAPAELRRGDFAERFLLRLEDAKVPPHRLQLEVTESVFLGSGAENVAAGLRTLNRAGVKIALDDFGTGFASLSHLKQFPVDFLKIDKSFIRGVRDSAEDEAIVRAVLGLGRSLGIEVVAEGIETAEQARFLRRRRCDYGQGFLFGAALPASEVPGLLASEMCPPPRM